MPTVTAIIPNYNHGPFLQRRIESVIQQSFQDITVILLDDASTDNSRQIMERYRDHPKISHIVFNKVNSGSPFLQWQKGLTLAQSDWIWIAESDDYCDPEFLAALSPVFHDPGFVMAYNEIDWVDEHEILLKPGTVLPEEGIKGLAFLKQYMLIQVHLVNAGMVVFRKNCAERISPYWMQMKQAGDYWFWCHMALQGNVFRSGKVLAKFVRHSAATSNQYLYSSIHYDEHITVLKSMLFKGGFNKADIRDFLLEQMIRLETQSKVNPHSANYAEWQMWKKYAFQFDIHIADIEIKLQSFNRKLYHWVKKNFTRIAFVSLFFKIAFSKYLL